MLGSLFKPKWLHKDAKVRIQAITSLAGDSPELIQLAQNDANTGVRLEAIAALTDIPTLIQLGKRSDTLGERARLRLIALVPTNNEHDDALLDVFEWLKSNPTLMGSLARDSERGLTLRKQALAEVQDEKLLFTIADQDVSREIQYQAASRLHQPDLLRQLEKKHGKSNKRLRQLLKERLAAEQAQQARLTQLETLCKDMEALGRTGQWAQDKTRQRILQQSWQKQQAEGAIPPELEKRFADAELEFNQRLEKHEAAVAAQAPLRAVFEQCLSDAEQLQAMLQQPDTSVTLDKVDAQLADLQARWQAAEALPETEQVALEKQWEQQWEALQAARQAVSGDLAALEALQLCCRRVERLRDTEQSLQAKQLTDLQADWVKIKRPVHLRDVTETLEQRFQQDVSSLNARLKREAEQRTQILAEIRQELEQMEADLEAEKYGEAVDLHRKITQRLQDHSDLPTREVGAIKRRLQAAAPMIMEFKDWRRWGTDQAREHLIETAERLERDETLDPQTRAKEIKALREEWRQLAQMEPGQQRKQWKTFDSKVTAAYEVSKQYFAEQASQREQHLQDREKVCAQLEALQAETDWDNVEDWHGIYVAINRQRKAWKQCGTVSHKDWKKVNERFNAAMDALEVHLAGERQRNFAERQVLVSQAQALLDNEDLAAATEEAKALQSQWQITVPGRPKDEQKLWKQFRAPIDEVFARLKEARQAQRSETEERIAQKEALCEQVEALPEQSDDDFTVAPQTLAELRKAFNELQDIPKSVQKKLEERFRKAEQAVRDRQAQLRWQSKLAELDTLATESQTQHQAASTLDAAALAANQQQGETLCLQLEILLDVPSPAEFQQARLEHQVAQMSEAMRSRQQNSDPAQQALSLLQQWYKLEAMPEAAFTSQQARIQALRSHLSGEAASH